MKLTTSAAATGAGTVQLAVAVAGAVLVAAYGWWVVSLPPFSLRATLAVLLAGVAASAAGWLLRRRDEPPRGSRGAAPWAVVAGTAALWQLSAYLQQPRANHPTLSSLTNAVLDSQPRRAAAFVTWLVVALVLARR